MRVEELPKELYDRVRNRFESDNEVRLLRTAQQDAQRRGEYMKAVNIAETLTHLWTVCLDNYLKKAETELSRLTIDSNELPMEDREEMMAYLLAVFMCCDIIESAVMDADEVLRRSKPGSSITIFSDLQDALGLAREKLKYLQEKGDYMKDLAWADGCDNMYQMMTSKARSIMRKRKGNAKWGDNMRKFYEETKD